MDFKKKNVLFTLKDVGSNVIDQISSDIYSGPGSMLRELVKNSYDSYLPISSDDLEEEGTSRDVVISRERSKAIGTIIIADNGIGQRLEELKANVQISISRKQLELEHATGFRGLGSWAILGAGSKIVITSTKKGDPRSGRLTLDVRKIYSRMGPNTTLDEILNDPTCIVFQEGVDTDNADRHGTVVEIECDGEPGKVGKYELNRLWSYTDPNDTELRKLLIQHCAAPFPAEAGSYADIHRIYTRTSYVPTSIVLDGRTLERRLPQELSLNWSEELRVNGRVAAYVWCAENPRATGEIQSIDEERDALGGPGIQLMRLNVPIGPKNIFNDSVRTTILNWYVGQVHIVLNDVLPNASGQDLRAGTAREAFIQELRTFYKRLEKRAEEKSARLSLERGLKKGMAAVKKLQAGGVSAAAQAQATAVVAKAVQDLQSVSTNRKPKNLAETRMRQAAADPTVIELRKQARKVFKDSGYLDHFTAGAGTAATGGSKRRAAAVVALAGKAGNGAIKVADFQARLGTALPRFRDAGLTPTQIQDVLKIIAEVLTN